LRAIEEYRVINLSKKEPKELLYTQFDMKKVPFSSNSLVRELEDDILTHRLSLLVELSKATARLLPEAFFEPSVGRKDRANSV